VGSDPTGGMDVCCECCVLLGRGLCDELITRPEESYRLWCVVVCDLETSWMRRPWPTGRCCAKNKLITWSRVLEKRRVPQSSISLHFMELESSLPHSQQPTTNPYSDQYDCNAPHPCLFISELF